MINTTAKLLILSILVFKINLFA